jgi:WD40 repeat protein
MWDVAPGKLRLEMRGHKTVVMSGLFTPDGSRIMTSDLGGEIIVWDTGTGARLAGPPRANKMSFLELSRNGTRLLSFSWDRTVRVWDTKSWDELAMLTDWEPITQGAISPDGKRFATVTAYDGVRIVPIDTAELIRIAKTHVTRDLSPDECLLYLQRSDCPPLPR